jgi:hypothetical protein
VRGRALGVILNRVARRDSAAGYYGGTYEFSDKDKVPATVGAHDGAEAEVQSKHRRRPA